MSWRAEDLLSGDIGAPQHHRRIGWRAAQHRGKGSRGSQGGLTALGLGQTIFGLRGDTKHIPHLVPSRLVEFGEPFFRTITSSAHYERHGTRLCAHAPKPTMHSTNAANIATFNTASIMLPSTESRSPLEVLICRPFQIFPVAGNASDDHHSLALLIGGPLVDARVPTAQRACLSPHQQSHRHVTHLALGAFHADEVRGARSQ